MNKPVFKNLKNNNFLNGYEHDKISKFNRSRKLGEEYLGWETTKIQKIPTIMPLKKEKKSNDNIERLVDTLLESPQIVDKLIEKLFESSKGQEIFNQKIEEKLEETTESDLSPFICNMSREIPDDQAEDEIKTFLQSLEDNNIEKFSMFEIVSKLNVPSEQVERVLDKLLIRD